MAYVMIDGVKYEQELIDLARAHTTGVGESKISRDEAVDIIDSAQDGMGITDTERMTLYYIRNHFDFTDSAAQWFDNEIAKW
ncbi:hypothetical protein [Paraferrimonas haliotis]|uniref:Uncharacterized protein n=1 Tax=Paraferrimonas haliotis TaxID=2013866 RepID=A0AA37TSE0_9GAMM|nr:hypothetical protein [Paraferrimonas haliotis]GLS84923.1 hypothetical protein GCM10007894_29000 [Paraferrimonas haliotis]